MNAAVKWDNWDYYNLGRILQLALNGFVNAWDDKLVDAGQGTEFWSADYESLNIGGLGGFVYHADEVQRDLSVRLLDTR